MRLKELVKSAGYAAPSFDAEVKDVVMDSRKVKQGSLFVAICGRSFDGHTKASEAVRDGAVAVVVGRSLGLQNEILVADTRKANAVLAAAFFGNPGRKLELIGVTGTNGKTTVSTVLKQSLVHLGQPSGLLGTIRNEVMNRVIPAKFTTPEPWDLNALLYDMTTAGCRYAVLEASSQALEQQRLFSQRFKAAVFTNLSRDHLDYHITIDNYFAAKKLLFDMADAAIVNADDEYGRALRNTLDIPVFSFSALGNHADFVARDSEQGLDGVTFTVDMHGESAQIRFPITGNHSVSNALAAFAALVACGIPAGEAASAVSASKGVKGRSELLHRGEFTVISDFAHTADGLRQLLQGFKPFVRGKMVVLFGCAGDRDDSKRADMARTVCDFGDLAVLTADNPRTENPVGTMGPLTEEFEKRGIPYLAEADREKAILWALSRCGEDDLLLLCGKGHEEYQVLDGYTVYLNEREIVESYFARKG